MQEMVGNRVKKRSELNCSQKMAFIRDGPQ